MMEEKLRLSGIMRESIVDGPGLRYTIFAQGCIHACKGCQNPQTHEFEGGFLASPHAILRDIKKNPLISGVTFSGGDPFCQAKAFFELGLMLKKEKFHIMTYTGYTYEEILSSKDPAMQDLLSVSDILVDGRFILEMRDLNLKFRGSSNQRLINVPVSLHEKKVVLANF